MGRKHKHSSLKYIKQNLMRENENLKVVNKSLQIMSNNATTRDIESRKKVVELENCNRAIMEIVEIQKEANDFCNRRTKYWKLNYPYLIIQKGIHRLVVL